MQKFKVVTTDDAELDLDDIVDYLSGFSYAIASRYYTEIKEKIRSLSTMPDRCSFVSYEPLRKKGYRWLFIRNYTVYFTIHESENSESTVVIRRVLYARRDYTALL